MHDLIPWLRFQRNFGPDRGSKAAALFIERTFKGLRRCDHLLAVSESTARDIAQHAEIDLARVSVVPVALDSSFGKAASVNQVKRECNVDRRYILHVGNNSFYKNRPAVVRIFARLVSDSDLRLVLAGQAPDKALLKQVHDLSLQDRIEFIEEIDDERLAQLYSDAALLLFPSLYEGFGWPPLEAMACGCPVVCSSEGSLPEVAGTAALMAPAGNERALANLCQSVLDDPALAEQMSHKGGVHARNYTLERMGRQTIAAYEQALGFQAKQDRV
jgi:glycosyltransferase involved in cell wall biosynthesis